MSGNRTSPEAPSSIPVCFSKLPPSLRHPCLNSVHHPQSFFQQLRSSTNALPSLCQRATTSLQSSIWTRAFALTVALCGCSLVRRNRVLRVCAMGKGGGKGKGGYPWWEHIKGGKGGGAKGGDDGGKAAAGYDGAAAGPPPKRSNGPISGLQRRLQEMEGRQYPSYKDLSGGGWEIEGRSMTLYFDRVQGDAYAPPSWIRARVSMSAAGFPATFVKESRVRNTALCDYVTRVLADLLHGGAGTDWTQTVQGAGWSSSKGGDIQVDAPGQYVIERTSVVANAEFIEARLTLALPAKGRSIEGYRAAEIVGGLCDAVKGALFYSSLDGTSLRGHIETVEDQDALRNQLCELGLVAFVGNGAILPRKSGVDDRPMTKADSPNLVDFKSPAAFEVTIKLPHAGQ
ncbi:unnamed protein product, partial [Polarella glacialis]